MGSFKLFVSATVVPTIIRIRDGWVEIQRIENESAIVDMSAACRTKEDAQRWAKV